jgi:hypothetical protein
MLVDDQDPVDQQWWALRNGPGASGFIIDSELLEAHHHAAEPCVEPYQSFLFVAAKHGVTLHRIAQVIKKYAAGPMLP